MTDVISLPAGSEMMSKTFEAPGSETRLILWMAWASATSWLLLAYGAALATGAPLDRILPYSLVLGVAGVLSSALALSADQRFVVRCLKFLGLVLLSLASAGAECLAIGVIDIFVSGLDGIQ